MRGAFQLLLICCLIWCALGVTEPAHAYAGSQEQGVSSVAHDDNSMADLSDDELSANHHHHCPVAPAIPWGSASRNPHLLPVPIFTARIAVLASLSRAPPLQPPATA